MNQTSCSSSNHVLWVLDYFILLSVLRGRGSGRRRGTVALWTVCHVHMQVFCLQVWVTL